MPSEQKKSLRRRLPAREDIFASRFAAPFARYFDHPCYWSLNRRSAALSVAVGLFAGLMPGPTQMLTALLIAYFVRSNLPLAVFTTLYTNPLTYMPLYYLAYRVGCLLLGVPAGALDFPALDGSFWHEVWPWLAGKGKPLLLGVPVLGTVFALTGYVAVSGVWRLMVAGRLKKRRMRRDG